MAKPFQHPKRTPQPERQEHPLCESWDHIFDRETPLARPGYITCGAHAQQEEEYHAVRSGLDPVERAMKYRKGEHSKLIGSRAEEAVQSFLETNLRLRGVRLATTFQDAANGETQRELDIAAPRDDLVGEWSARFQTRTISADDELAIHVEVTREAYRKKKFLTDIKKLARSARQAVAQGAPGLPSACFVALGQGWKPATVMSVMHEAVHQDLRQVELRGRRWWPIPDLIVIPGAVFKKHEVLLERNPARAMPAYQFIATAADSAARGLVVARAFVEHRVDVLLEKRAPDSDAFDYVGMLAEFGPRSMAIETAGPAMSAFLMRDPESDGEIFSFDGWHDRAGLYIPMRGGLEPTTRCTKGAPYRVLPTKT
ncbi:MAG TPA: hypothetical protein RMH99_12500 [Sandaracinaceae bacterium LLY-WYZ-13_1]|nr:hypothetical protein [Sandaracinaceae bacterium LLY-WYZ-13_1]